MPGSDQAAKRRTQFQLRHIFLLTAAFAVFFAIRSWGIEAELEAVVVLSPVLLAAFCAILAGVNGFRHGTMFFIAAVVGLAASTWWALECVSESSGSEFLRRNQFQAQYTIDAAWNAFVVVVVTGVSTVVGGTCGTIARLRWSHPHWVFYGSTSRYGDEPVDRMHHKPSTAPTARAPTESSGIWMVRTIFYAHVTAIIVGTFVVCGYRIIPYGVLGSLITLILISTWFLCPTAVLVVVLSRKPRSPTFRIFAVAAEVLLSAIQIFIWLPSIQYAN